MNKTIGLGSGNTIDLWVEVLKETSDQVDFRVINGDWYGHYTHYGVLTCYAPSGNTTHKIEKYFMKEIPNFSHRNYNEAIAWMNGKVFDIDPFLTKPKNYQTNFDNWDDNIAF